MSLTRTRTLTALAAAAAALAVAVPGPAALGAPAAPTPVAGSGPAAPGATAAPTQPWDVLPPTPGLPPGGKRGWTTTGGARIFHVEYGRGHGRPVVLLHGGPASSEYLGLQVRALQAHHRRVIAVDTRGHGRSTGLDAPFSYDRFADDVVAVLDDLHVRRADVVGWSDGGITALDLAMRHPRRVCRVLTFGANTTTEGVFPDAGTKPAFKAFEERAPQEFRRLSPTPGRFGDLTTRLGDLYAGQPSWTDADLRRIRARVLVMAGEHDEAIRPEHTRSIARTIPGARLHVLPRTSHFGFLQDPKAFDAVMLGFLR